ncbi:MAG: rhomboid family intramembrane serine protease [Nanoarchaeota archaeon]|nr:rhomboid family intramembrane serine protease [Nanoarchaeota archaeon]
MAKIESESQFIWTLIGHILLTPVTLFLVLFNKKDVEELLKPFSLFFSFVIAAKFTFSIILINVVMFIWSFSLSREVLSGLILYPSDLFFFRFHSLITAGFLHANAIHLAGNCVGIFIFGRIVEKHLGILKTAMIYFGALIVSGVFSSLIHFVFLGDHVGGLGASGALMGLIAAAILLDPFHLTYELLFPLPVMFVGWLTLYADIAGVLNPIEDGIGHFAHIGGFISVALVMYFIGVETRTKMKKGLLINIASLVAASVLYVVFTSGVL